jgi:hypothetical protein
LDLPTQEETKKRRERPLGGIALGRGGGGWAGRTRRGGGAQEALEGGRRAWQALWGLCVVWSCRRSDGHYVCTVDRLHTHTPCLYHIIYNVYSTP